MTNFEEFDFNIFNFYKVSYIKFYINLSIPKLRDINL